MNAIELSIDHIGMIRSIFADEITELFRHGEASVERASYVEPRHGPDGVEWTADMAPSSGPLLGPFATRGEAITAEVEWLKENREL